MRGGGRPTTCVYKAGAADGKFAAWEIGIVSLPDVTIAHDRLLYEVHNYKTLTEVLVDEPEWPGGFSYYIGGEDGGYINEVCTLEVPNGSGLIRVSFSAGRTIAGQPSTCGVARDLMRKYGEQVAAG